MKKLILVVGVVFCVAAGLVMSNPIIDPAATTTRQVTKIEYDADVNGVVVFIEGLDRTRPVISMSDFSTEAELRVLIAERIKKLEEPPTPTPDPTPTAKIDEAKKLEGTDIEYEVSR